MQVQERINAIDNRMRTGLTRTEPGGPSDCQWDMWRLWHPATQLPNHDSDDLEDDDDSIKLINLIILWLAEP